MACYADSEDVEDTKATLSTCPRCQCKFSKSYFKRVTPKMNEISINFETLATKTSNKF